MFRPNQVPAANDLGSLYSSPLLISIPPTGEGLVRVSSITRGDIHAQYDMYRYAEQG